MKDSTELASTAAFFEKVFAGHTGHTVLVTWTGGAFGKGYPTNEKWFSLPAQLGQMASYVEANAEQDVYFTPFTFSERKRQKVTAKDSPAVYADLDGCPPVNLVCEPTLLWETSPGRHQALWLVDRMRPEDAEELSHGVAVHHKEDGCDGGGWDIGQLLRVPGSTHNKRAPHKIAPAKVGPSYSFDDFVDFYDGVESGPAPVSGTSTAREDTDIPKHIAKRLSERVGPRTDRSKERWNLIQVCVEWGMSDGQILGVLDQHQITQSIVREKGRNLDTLHLNEIAKHRMKHPHTGMKCDEAKCKNAPEWMKPKHDDDCEEDYSFEIDPEPTIVVTTEVTAPEKEEPVKQTVRVPGAPVLLDGWDGDLSGYEQEPHLIQNLMEKGTACWLVGPSGSYKSFIALSMAAAIASGTEWYGRETFRGPVVYICSEGSRNWRKRIAAYTHHFGVSVDRDALYLIDAPVQLDSDEWDKLQILLASVQPHLIVVDTQAQCTNGYEENSNTEMSAVANKLRTMAQATGGTVLTVHHSGKDGDKGGRGASSIYAAADTEIMTKKITGLDGEERSVELKVTKQKDMPMGNLISLDAKRVVFEKHLDYYGNPLESLVMVERQGGSSEIPRGTSPRVHAQRLYDAGITEAMGRDRLKLAAKEKGVQGLPGKTDAWREIAAEHKKLVES
jgi:putative DNA primase/helicase